METLEELFDYAIAFAYQPIPRGNGTVVVSNAGGPDPLLTGPEVEAKVESDVKILLLYIGIKATKISENSVRTPDYGNVRIAFEATTVHPYYPRMAEIDKAIDELQNNLGICYHAYMYLD
jgi:hypothetical protein